MWLHEVVVTILENLGNLLKILMRKKFECQRDYFHVFSLTDCCSGRIFSFLGEVLCRLIEILCRFAKKLVANLEGSYWKEEFLLRWFLSEWWWKLGTWKTILVAHSAQTFGDCGDCCWDSKDPFEELLKWSTACVAADNRAVRAKCACATDL